MGFRPWAALAAVALAAGWAAVPGTAAAQDVRVAPRVEARQDCRCVDRDGNAIENCTCMRIPRVEIIRGPGMAGLFERRAQIGVWIDDGQGDDVDRLGGARITEVQEDGPAAAAGLRAGDIVLRVGDHALTDPLPDQRDEESLNLEGSIPVQRFTRLVGALEPGETVEFQILREGSRRTVSVTPEEAEGIAVRVGEGPAIFFDQEGLRRDMEELRMDESRLREELERMREREMAPGERVWSFRMEPPQPGDSVRGRSAFTFFGGDPCIAMHSRGGGEAFAILAGGGNCVDGVEFMELNEDLAEYFQAEEGGVLVTEVSEESALGLRAGDVLLAVGGREVRDAGHIRRILASYEQDEEIRLRVIRKGSEIEVLGRRRNQ